MFETKFLATSAQPGSLNLVGSSILVDPNDYEGVLIAASTLSEDFAKVAGGNASPVVYDTSEGDIAIIIGSLTHSSIVKTLIQEKKIDVSTIKDQWECYITQLVENPFNGCSRALVIVGSDKRGTIFGTYTLSQQMGVSP